SRARQKAEASRALLEKTVAQLDTLLATVPVGLAFFDTEMRYTRINDKLAAWNCLSPERVLGRTVHEVLAPDVAARITPYLRQVLSTRAVVGPLEISAALPASPGEDSHFLATYFPVPDADGAVSHVGVVVIDVTAQKRAALELSRTVRYNEMFAGILG